MTRVGPPLPFGEAVAAAGRARAAAGRGGVPPRACVIGGGGTGLALAYDLALRGLEVILVEKGELTSGTTGRHHGQLHCGARYALGDRAIARECMEESLVLARIVPEAIEYNGGLFAALDEAGLELEPAFAAACREAGIPAEPLPAGRALELEPALNPRLLGVVAVPDGSFDAFRLPLAFAAAARELGASIRPWTEVLDLERSSGRVIAAIVLDRGSDPPRELRIEADYFACAAGAWAGAIGGLAGVDVPVSPAAGSMVAARGRLVDRVVSRLAPAGDGDILVPQRGLTIIGTTQRLASSPENLRPEPGELPFLLGRAAELVPAFAGSPLHAAWSAARPLAGRPEPGGDSRSISRDFAVLDHAARDAVDGLCSIVGGKATVLRAMAEKAADLVCSRLGVAELCRSSAFLLPTWRRYYSRGFPWRG